MDVSEEALAVWTILEHCTLEARRVVLRARQAVSEIGGQEISPEHLLCALLDADALASRHLVALPMNANELRDRVKGIMSGSPRSDSVDVPLTDEATRILKRAWAEAGALGQRKLRSDHILLGLLGGDSPAATLLKTNGVVANVVRESIPARDPDEDES